MGGNSYTGSLEAVKLLAGLSGSASISAGDAKLLTPPSTVRAFAAGYRVVMHESVGELVG